MPLNFEGFVKSQYKQLVLAPEDQPQDERDWKRLLKEDQQKQYAQYLKQFKSDLPDHSVVESEPIEQWAKKHGVTLPVTKQLTQLRNNGKSRAEYMRNYRKKPKYCPHCKKQI